jgi:predicted DNA-binding helix-hairpin-helix protein
MVGAGMDLLRKLQILADAAKYDASCPSSGTEQRHSRGAKAGIGSTEGMAICHAYAPDGCCISLPVDVNQASREQLLRVPGMGVKSVDRILNSRRHRRLGMNDLARLALSLGKVGPFIVAADHRPRGLDRAGLARSLPRLASRSGQMGLFA